MLYFQNWDLSQEYHFSPFIAYTSIAVSVGIISSRQSHYKLSTHTFLQSRTQISLCNSKLIINQGVLLK